MKTFCIFTLEFLNILSSEKVSVVLGIYLWCVSVCRYVVTIENVIYLCRYVRMVQNANETNQSSLLKVHNSFISQ